MDIVKYCLSKSGARADYPFGPEPLVIKVGNKMFALISASSGILTVSLKCDPFVAQSLRQQYQAVKPGYHLNKQHWNTVTPDDSIPDEEIMRMLDHSYELVVKGLSKSDRAVL